MNDDVRCPTRSNFYALFPNVSLPCSSSSSSSVAPFLQPMEQVTFTGCKWTGKSSDIHAHLKTCGFVQQKCSSCQTEFPRRCTSAHINSCKGKDYLSCPVCFVSLPSAEAHMKHVSECENITMVCDFCKMNVPFKYMGQHTDECAEYPLFCNKCQQEGPRKFMTLHQIGGSCIVYNTRVSKKPLLQGENERASNQNLHSSGGERSEELERREEQIAPQSNSGEVTMDHTMINSFMPAVELSGEVDEIRVTDLRDLAKTAEQYPENPGSASLLETIRKYRESVYKYDGATFNRHIDEGIQRLGAIYFETKQTLNGALREIQEKERKIQVSESIIKNLSQDIRSSTEFNHRMVMACKHRDEQLYQLRELEKIVTTFEDDDELSRGDFLRMVNSIPSKRPQNSQGIKTEVESTALVSEENVHVDTYLTDEFGLHNLTKRKMRLDSEERIKKILESNESSLENGLDDKTVTKDIASTSQATKMIENIVSVVERKEEVKEREKHEQKKNTQQNGKLQEETASQEEATIQRETYQENGFNKQKETLQIKGTSKHKEVVQLDETVLEGETTQTTEASRPNKTVLRKDAFEEKSKEGTEKKQQEGEVSIVPDADVTSKINFCMNILRKQRSLKRQAHGINGFISSTSSSTSHVDTEEEVPLKRATPNGASDSDSDTFEF